MRELTERRREALELRCKGFWSEDAAEQMGITKNAFNLLVKFATEALDVPNPYAACYRLGKMNASSHHGHKIFKKRQRKRDLERLYKGQIAAAREGETGRRTALGTDRNEVQPRT